MMESYVADADVAASRDVSVIQRRVVSASDLLASDLSAYQRQKQLTLPTNWQHNDWTGVMLTLLHWLLSIT